MTIQITNKSMFMDITEFDGYFQHFQDDCSLYEEDLVIRYDEGHMQCCGRDMTKEEWEQ